MTPQKAIIGTSNYWSSPFQVGMHQIARALVKLGWQVAFLSVPISPFHIINAKNNQFNERFEIYKQNGLFDLNDQLWAYVPGAIFTHNNRPILRSGWLQNNWNRLTLPNLKQMLDKNGFSKVDLVLVDYIDYANLRSTTYPKKTVYRIADNNLGFTSFTRMQRKKELQFASNADLVFYSAKKLQNYVQKLGPKASMYLPNGVNFQHFQGLWDIPEDLAKIRPPIAIYVGALNYWFDYRLIEYAAKSLPELSFVLIGPDKNVRKNINPSNNLHILGPKSYHEIPRYITHSNIGIIPFNLKDYPDLVNSINPLKLYEYLACGLPVIATAWDELVSINSPALLYHSHIEFVELLKRS